MKNYSVTQPKENGIYSLGDNIYTQIYIKNIAGVLDDPSSVSISITCPHGRALVSDVSMTSTVTGIYSYDFSIPTDICYGIYKIKIETTGDSSRTYFNFVVFPWDVLSRIREISGAFQQSDMSDYKLSIIAWNAYEETLREIYELHTNERPLSDPTSGAYLDGVNTIFQVRHRPIADINGDAEVTGYEPPYTTHDWDLDFYYTDSLGNVNIGMVIVVDIDEGIVALTDPLGNPLPADTRSLQLTYYSESPTYHQDLMREAVAYLAAHKALIAFKSLDKATLADLQSNRSNESQRFLKRYEDLIEQIGHPMIGSGK
jgi:hypothetical protein